MFLVNMRLNEKLAITLRNVEVDALNLGIREVLKERGVIGGESSAGGGSIESNSSADIHEVVVIDRVGSCCML
jgi:hypothetical protein